MPHLCPPVPLGRCFARTGRSLSVLIAAGVLACGGDGGTNPTPAVTVSVSPSTSTVGAAEELSLSATVSNAADGAVSWTSTGGTVTGTGTAVVWTAPLAAGSYTVTATSVEDPSARASATLTVTGVQVSLTPSQAVLLRSEPATFTATVSGTTASTSVTWATTCGTLAADGGTAAYEAPAEAGACTVTATSDLDASVSASATVAVRSASAVTTEADDDDGLCDWAHCSLREAIVAANADPAADTIYLSVDAVAASATAGRLPSAGAPRALIQLAGPLPTITTEVAIIGEGRDLTDLDMQGAGRAFDISGAPVALRGLTIRNGLAQGGGAIYVRDGAVLTGADLLLIDNGAVEGEGGAMVVVGEGTAAHLVNVAFEGNQTATAGWPGGALSVVGSASLHMVGGRFVGNRSSAWGGAVRGFDAESIRFEGTLFEDNAVLEGGFGGGAVFLENPGGAAGVVEFDGATITGNSGPGIGPGGGGGGGLYLRTGLDVTLVNSTITDNDAGPDGWGGGLHLATVTVSIEESTVSGNAAEIGGGIFVNGADLTLVNSSIDDNDGIERGGGLFLGITSTLTASGGTLSRNTAGTLGGGGLFAQQDPTIDMTGTRIEGNQAVGVGGGFAVFGNLSFVGSDLDIVDNVAAAAGGLYYNGMTGSSVTLEGALVSGNATTGDGFSGGGIFAEGAGFVTLLHSTIESNDALDGSGGGLFSFLPILMAETVVRNNTAGAAGGGLWLRGNSVISNTEFSGNHADTNGGAISGGHGTVVQGSTFAGNSADLRGGGVFVVQNGATTPTFRNATFSGNTADQGGGIATLGALDLIHTSFVDNAAATAGGAAFVYTTGDGSIVGALSSVNSVFQGNTGAGDVAESCHVDVATGGSIDSDGGNVTDDATCGFSATGDQSGVDPMLAGLADNGGSTPTHAPLTGSPALDAGVDAGTGFDQTGAARDDGAPDSGAVEGTRGG